MKKTNNTLPTGSVRALALGALALASVGCTESSVMLPDASVPTDAMVHADASAIDSGPVVDAATARVDAAVDAAINNADAARVDASAWEDDAGPDTNPYLRG